jgi:hypothetical protein
MLGERLKFSRLSKLFSTILLILFIVFSLSFSSRAFELPRQSQFQALGQPFEAVQDARQTPPTARTEVFLYPGTLPIKSLWLAAAIGLIYCLRRPKKA